MDLERELTNRYLLGMATEAEDEEIGVRIIEDPIFAEEVTQAEIDLIEDYLEGELSAPEHELFEQQYLISDDRRERVREIALLKKYSALSGEFAAVVEPTVKTIMWYRNFKILVPAFGLLVLAAVAGLFFIDRGIVGGVDYAQLNRQDLRDPAVVGNAQIVEVNPGTYRSGTPGSITVVAGDSSAVLFRLPLTFAVDANALYDGSIERDGRKVFSVEPVRLYTEGGTTEAMMIAPREKLAKGTYQIKLVRRDSDNAPILYTFDVR
jgi:hypothetical protein